MDSSFEGRHRSARNIVDFLCHKARLIIEVDGTSHDSPGAQLYDREREQFFRTQRFTILRFRNLQILESMEWVLLEIGCALLPREADELRREYVPG